MLPEVIMMAGTSAGFKNVEHWSQQLQNGLKGLEKNRKDEMLEVLSVLLRETWLEDNCRAIALAHQGMFSFFYLISQNNSSQVECKTENFSDLNQIIEAFTQAVSLVPDKGEYFMYRGIVRMFKGDIDEAKSDLNRGLQLNTVDKNLKELTEFILNSNFASTIKTLKGLFQEDFEQFNIFQKDVIDEKVEKEIQRIEKEIQSKYELIHLNKEIQMLKEKTAKQHELIQKIWRLMEKTNVQGEEIQNLTEEAPTIKEYSQMIIEFLQRSKEEIQKLEGAIQSQRNKEEPQGSKEEIQKLEEELQRKKRERQNIIEEARKLIE
jgi:DNA repair exonuclease SbcCD ATPase subunit